MTKKKITPQKKVKSSNLSQKQKDNLANETYQSLVENTLGLADEAWGKLSEAKLEGEAIQQLVVAALAESLASLTIELGIPGEEVGDLIQEVIKHIESTVNSQEIKEEPEETDPLKLN